MSWKGQSCRKFWRWQLFSGWWDSCKSAAGRHSHLYLYCRLTHTHKVSSEKRRVYALALDTPFLSDTEWYCAPVPNQCTAICSTCFSLRARLRLVIQRKKVPNMLRSSSIFTKLDGTCRYIHNSPPSHYNSLCFCKFLVPESPQVRSRIHNHWSK
jgi:hypothetical protein